MAEILTAYLREQAGRPFKYGTVDCATFVCGWFDLLTGKTAAKDWAEKYQTENECNRFIAKNGGFVAIADSFLAEKYQVERATDCAIGNAVFASVKNTQAMGIRCGLEAVALRTPHGIHVAQKFIIISEWGFPCHK